MRILLLTQIVPYPPDSGPKIKTHNVLRYLAQRHEVHLVSFARSAAEIAAADSLRDWCAGVTTVPLQRAPARDALFLARSIFSGRPFLIERDDLRTMHEAIARVCRRIAPEAVHADQLSMGQFAVELPVKLRVLDEHNAVWTIVKRAAEREVRGVRRLLAELEWRKLQRYEGEICGRFDHVTVVSQDDRAALEQVAGRSLPATVIPIAVDTHELPVLARDTGATDIVSVATMFYPPNVEGIQWFSEAVFPLVRQAMPTAQFRVIGSRPPAHIRRLEAPNNGIDVMGYVADLQPILQRSAVLVVPLRSGSGMRVKILEAFSRGLPVISTRVGVEGIDAHPGEHLLVADEPADFARAVLQLLHDPARAAQLTAAARRLVEERYDWRTALVGLDQLYPVTSPKKVESIP